MTLGGFGSQCVLARVAVTKSAHVLIVTPTTLIALAKAVAFGWRQEKLAVNARRVADLGRDLYKRLQIMGGHLVQVGSSIDRTVRNYNAFVGSLEGSVMPQARKFTDLEVEGTQDPIEVIEPVERDVRVIRTDRDLVILDSPMLDGALNAREDCAVAGANAPGGSELHDGQRKHLPASVPMMTVTADR
jgi:hypothetical protein